MMERTNVEVKGDVIFFTENGKDYQNSRHLGMLGISFSQYQTLVCIEYFNGIVKEYE